MKLMLLLPSFSFSSFSISCHSRSLDGGTNQISVCKPSLTQSCLERHILSHKWHLRLVQAGGIEKPPKILFFQSCRSREHRQGKVHLGLSCFFRFLARLGWKLGTGPFSPRIGQFCPPCQRHWTVCEGRTPQSCRHHEK